MSILTAFGQKTKEQKTSELASRLNNNITIFLDNMIFLLIECKFITNKKWSRVSLLSLSTDNWVSLLFPLFIFWYNPTSPT